MSPDTAPFTKTLTNLRIYEELTLYGNLLDISETDEQDALQFLSSEYEDESLNYPYEIPKFDAKTALWGAKVLYTAAQLMLFRQHRNEELPGLIGIYTIKPSPAEMLSADLCLRFLPDILHQLKSIDPEDVLIDVLENILQAWHYSAIAYQLDYTKLNLEHMEQNQCFFQLYLNRIAEYKNLRLARHAFFAPYIAADLGIYTNELWNDFRNRQPSDE